MSQSIIDAKRFINNIMNNFNDINCRKVWPDFNPEVTLGIKECINKYSLTDIQLLTLIHIDAGWNHRISNFNFNNPMNNPIVYNHKNKINTYRKDCQVVKTSKKNISKTQIISKNQPRINAFFTKA